ncbi:hypothetical protein TPL01_06860 [Sulfuriferula plumbiphila]|uniref:Uncharacterized protein n=1 Tax=Sulfuriferula plumbiphila TaxID=171865 RepID=A0A512L4Z4_9PROT|nr:hypothetical protein [Sulfuriferula plumbiphila]BBP03261.1 hypothetical protein SFPGR_06830 [Sulfuriferula plumbiphila]GEP29548.1 hypothetical protein TPL01_06860 [Sulfuriferula plumbiphila]
MKIRNLIPVVSLGLGLGGVAPAFAAPAFYLGPALDHATPLLLASRDGDTESRGNGRDRAGQRGDGDNRRQQNEVRRDERQGGFGYGFERRQERGERPANDGRDRQQN